jgi:Peptidase_C39 like family/Tetratricopeptide repeat
VTDGEVEHGVFAWLIRSLLVAAMASGCAHVPPAALPDGTRAAVELTDTPFFPQQSHQCGPAALATVLNAADAAVSPEQLVPQTYLPGRRGSLQLELIAAARTHRRIPYVIDPTLTALIEEIDAGHPVLVFQDLGVGPLHAWHYAVVIGYRRDSPAIVLRSGGTERLVMPLDKFARSWRKADHWALVIPGIDQLPATAMPGRYVESILPMEAMGDDATAQAAYTAALQRWPENFVALFGLANTSYRLGEAQAAQQAYERLLDLAPDNPIVLNNLAEVLLERGCPVLAGGYADAALVASGATGELAAAIEDTRAKAAKMRAQRGDAPECNR